MSEPFTNQAAAQLKHQLLFFFHCFHCHSRIRWYPLALSLSIFVIAIIVSRFCRPVSFLSMLHHLLEQWCQYQQIEWRYWYFHSFLSISFFIQSLLFVTTPSSSPLYCTYSLFDIVNESVYNHIVVLFESLSITQSVSSIFRSFLFSHISVISQALDHTQFYHTILITCPIRGSYKNAIKVTSTIFIRSFLLFGCFPFCRFL